MEFISKTKFSIQAIGLYSILNEINDIDNEPIFNIELLTKILLEFGATYKRKERNIFIILWNLYSSEEAIDKYKNTVDIKYLEYIHTIFAVVIVLFSKLDLQKVNEHYTKHIEEMLHNSNYCEGDYLSRCNFIQSFIKGIKKFNEITDSGLYLTETTISGNDTDHKITFTFK